MTLVLLFDLEWICRAGMPRYFCKWSINSHFLLSRMLCSFHERVSGVMQQKAGEEERKIKGAGRKMRL